MVGRQTKAEVTGRRTEFRDIPSHLLVRRAAWVGKYVGIVVVAEARFIYEAWREDPAPGHSRASHRHAAVNVVPGQRRQRVLHIRFPMEVPHLDAIRGADMEVHPRAALKRVYGSLEIANQTAQLDGNGSAGW